MRIGPSLEIESVAAPNEFIFVANGFTMPERAGMAQNDGRVLGENGEVSELFAIGQWVRVWKADLSFGEAMRIVEFDAVARRVRFASPPDLHPLSPGQLITNIR